MEHELLRAAAPVAKVCGITNRRDLEHAAEAGADLVGLVSWAPSPRHVTDVEVVALGHAASALGVHAILVTVDRPRADVDAVVSAGGLAGAQLCGDERPGDWTDFVAPPRAVVGGLPSPYAPTGAPQLLLRRVGAGPGALDEVERWRRAATAFVVDRPESPGGTGEAVDLDAALEVARAAPALLAGGLDAARVGALPGLVASFLGFDASSRLESAPRTKDHRAVADFVSTSHARRRAESLR